MAGVYAILAGLALAGILLMLWGDAAARTVDRWGRALAARRRHRRRRGGAT